MKPGTHSETDSRYWVQRVYRPRNSQGRESPHFAVQMQVGGRHMSLGLHTGNREVAARKAAQLYSDFATLGVEATLARHRPKRQEAEQIASVGEYLSAARAVERKGSHLRGIWTLIASDCGGRSVSVSWPGDQCHSGRSRRRFAGGSYTRGCTGVEAGLCGASERRCAPGEGGSYFC